MHRQRRCRKKEEEMRLRLLSKSDLIVVYVLCAHIKELMIRNIGCARSYTKHPTNNSDDDETNTNEQNMKTEETVEAKGRAKKTGWNGKAFAR